MTGSVEIPEELAIEVCRAMISCLEELTAEHVIKYGHVEETKNTAVLRKMQYDDRTRQKLIPVLIDFHDHLERNGVKVPLDERPNQGADE